ncbi:hypothetical protein [Paractinoplanes hotanensis]|uniref:Uncharacterized protein n=1 Tax=Paractinoplanes hotanensis TaxID=2906497 RepID=A0ABT0YHK6_9ACTN|nr:hypothetical protein [Actinoplanes hotanensis]MCM4084993.1 hypothetical protein [Actinoplanes hotanensis]
MNRTIEEIDGVRELELPVTIVPPARTGEQSWVRCLSLFRTEFPGWAWS